VANLLLTALICSACTHTAGQLPVNALGLTGSQEKAVSCPNKMLASPVVMMDKPDVLILCWTALIVWSIFHYKFRKLFLLSYSGDCHTDRLITYQPSILKVLGLVETVASYLDNKSIRNRCGSQWPRNLRRRPSSLGQWDRGFKSRLRHGCLFLSFCVILSCVSRGLCDGPITHPKESYQVSRLRKDWGGQGPSRDCKAREEGRSKTDTHHYYHNRSRGEPNAKTS
jgi:hypothetical protein